MLAVWAFVALLGLLAWYAYDLPDVARLGERTRMPSVRIVSADGVQLARFGDVYAAPVRARDLPEHLRQAVIATEDRRFYRHFGLDVLALARAALANIKAGRIVQGGTAINLTTDLWAPVCPAELRRPPGRNHARCQQDPRSTHSPRAVIRRVPPVYALAACPRRSCLMSHECASHAR